MRRILKLIFVIGVMLSIWAFWWEPRSYVINESTVVLQDWPQNCSGLKVAILTDLHAGAPHITIEKMQTLVKETNAQNPDLILLAGDYVIQGVKGGKFIEPSVIASTLQNLSAPLGVYAVLGNHDWWHSGEQITNAFDGVGIPVLENHSVVKTTINNCSFVLAGIGDSTTQHDNVSEALASAPSDLPILAFTHNPDIFPEIPESITLLIAGHTHGGQVNLPILGRLIVPSKFGERYAIGHVQENGKDLFVSTGIGTSIIPVRFRVPPEIAILNIVSSVR